MARRLHQDTTMTLNWMAKRLDMGFHRRRSGYGGQGGGFPGQPCAVRKGNDDIAIMQML